MANEEKEWTFVDDDDGFLVMKSGRAFYSAQKGRDETGQEVKNPKEERSESSGSETEFEVISKNEDSSNCQDDADGIQIKEDHFLLYQPHVQDLQDDGSDIEVVKEIPIPASPQQQAVSQESANELLSVQNVVGESDIEEMDVTVSYALGDTVDTISDEDSNGAESFMQIAKYTDDTVTESKFVDGFESLTTSLVNVSEEFVEVDSPLSSLGIAELFQRATEEVVVDDDETETRPSAEDKGGSPQLEYCPGQSTKTSTLVLVVCASVAIGLILGRGLSGNPTDVTNVPSPDRNHPTFQENAQDTPQSQPTSSDADRKKEQLLTHSLIWNAIKFSSKCQRKFLPAYQQLQIENAILKKELDTVKNEYRLFRLYTVMRQTKYKEVKENLKYAEAKQRCEILNARPIPPKRLLFRNYREYDVRESSVDKETRDKIINLKSDVMRHKRKAAVWRQRFLNTRLQRHNECPRESQSDTEVLSLKHCFKKLGQFFNFTDIFQPSMKERARESAASYFKKIIRPVSKLQSKVSGGLQGVGKKFDTVWQILKGSWRATPTNQGQSYSECKESQKESDEKSNVKDSEHEIRQGPHHFKWARFRRMLHISNIVGALKTAVGRKPIKTTPNTVNQGEGKPKESVSKIVSEKQACIKKGLDTDCFKDFKDRWSFRGNLQMQNVERSVREKPRTTKEAVHVTGETVLDKSSNKQEVHVSYPLPRFPVPETNNRERKKQIMGMDLIDASAVKEEDAKSGTGGQSNVQRSNDSGPESALHSGGVRKEKQVVQREVSKRDALKKLSHEIEEELRKKFQWLEERILQTFSTKKTYNKDKISEEEKSTVFLFKLRLNDFENLLRRYSNRVRESRRNFQDKIKMLRREVKDQRQKLKKQRIQFNLWAMTERLQIKKELESSLRSVGMKMDEFKRWRNAVKEKLREEKTALKLWLKAKEKDLLSRIKKVKKENDQQLSKKYKLWLKKKMESVKQLVREERQRVKNIHKLYKYMLKKAKQKLEDEKHLYEKAKEKAVQLLQTYEILLHKFREEQAKGENPFAGNQKDSQSPGEGLGYPSVFCADQHSCTMDDQTEPTIINTPLVYCPNQNGCKEMQDNDQLDNDRLNNDVAARNANEERAGVTRKRRSFRDTVGHKPAKIDTVKANKKETIFGDTLQSARSGNGDNERARVGKQTSRVEETIRRERRRLQEKASDGETWRESSHWYQKEQKKSRDHDRVLSDAEIRGADVQMSMESVIARVRKNDDTGSVFTKESKEEETNKNVDQGKSVIRVRWIGPVVYRKKMTIANMAERQPTSIAWRGPIQYSPSTILIHDHMIPTMHELPTGKQRVGYRSGSLRRDENTVRKDRNLVIRPKSTPPAVIYKNGLPRYVKTVNSSFSPVENNSGTEQHYDVNEDEERESDFGASEDEISNHAMPFSWYLFYVKGRNDARSDENEAKHQGDSEWYFKMMDNRRKDHHESVLDNADWYLKMMRERERARSVVDTHDSWYRQRMGDRIKMHHDSDLNWYVKIMEEKRRALGEGVFTNEKPNVVPSKDERQYIRKKEDRRHKSDRNQGPIKAKARPSGKKKRYNQPKKGSHW